MYFFNDYFSVIDLDQYWHMDIYFTLWIIAYSYFHFLLDLFQLGLWELFLRACIPLMEFIFCVRHFCVVSELLAHTAPRETISLARVQCSFTVSFHFSFQFSSVTQLCPTLCNTMDCSTPGFPVHHQLPELAQTHVNWVGDAIQPSHPLSSPSPPAFNLSHHQGLFKWVSSLHQVAKVLEFQLQHQSFQWILRTDFLYVELVRSLCSLRDSQKSSPTPQFKSINSSVLSFL